MDRTLTPQARATLLIIKAKLVGYDALMFQHHVREVGSLPASEAHRCLDLLEKELKEGRIMGL